MAHDVFISHARQDKAIADATCAALEHAGIRCWIAPRDIEPGADWGASLMDGLKASKILVLVLSSSANASPHIRREVERAVHQGTTIVPLRIEEVLPEGALEYHLGTVHWLDAMAPPLEAHLQRLTDIIAAILTRIASTAHPLAPAKEPPVPKAEPPASRVEVPEATTSSATRRSETTAPEPPRPAPPPVVMVEPPAPPPAPFVTSEQSPLSEAGRLINVFIAPRKTFSDLRRSPRWWVALLVLLGVRLVWCVAFYSFLARHGLSPASLFSGLLGLRAVYLMPVSDAILYAAGAGLCFAACKNLAGGRELTFSRTFAVLLYSNYPSIVGFLLRAPTLLGVLPGFSLGGAIFIPWMRGMFNLPISSPILGIVASLDVFDLWYLVLAGLGISQVSEVKRSTATVVVVIVFCVLTLVRVLLLH